MTRCACACVLEFQDEHFTDICALSAVFFLCMAMGLFVLQVVAWRLRFTHLAISCCLAVLIASFVCGTSPQVSECWLHVLWLFFYIAIHTFKYMNVVLKSRLDLSVPFWFSLTIVTLVTKRLWKKWRLIWRSVLLLSNASGVTTHRITLDQPRQQAVLVWTLAFLR